MRGAAVRTATLLALAATIAGPPAQSQTLGSVNVGPFKSQKVCSLYADYWGDWLVEECHNNFAALRARVRSALTESGRLGVTMAPGRYSVTGTVTEVGVQSTSGGGATYAVGGNRAFAGLDVKMVDTRTGRLVWGGTVTRSVDAGSYINAGAGGAASGMGPQAIYTSLQRELALAAARGIAFHIDPLRVAAVDGGSVRVNYGGPLLELGDQLDVVGGDGRPIRYRVTSASGDGAWAKAESAGLQPTPGASVTYIEKESGAANARRVERVELP